jgi:glycosyltransferase involved in cell wall biosynthesis
MARRIGPVRIDLACLWTLRRFLHQRGIELVHAHNAGPLIYAGIASLTLFPRPRLVYSEHNQIYSASETNKRKFRLYARMAHAFIAVSQDLGRTLERELGKLQMLEIIPNGIDGGRFRASEEANLRSELGVNADDFIVGTGVVLSEQKGIKYLIEAAEIVLAQKPNACFIVAGDGPLRSELEARAAERRFGDRFRFLGYRADMPKVIASFDLYVLPSLWEGMPLALIEAMAMGKPIVCTAVGGSSEVVVEGETGFLVRPADSKELASAILRLAGDREFLSSVAERSRSRFEQFFSERAMTDAHQQFFGRVLAPVA